MVIIDNKYWYQDEVSIDYTLTPEENEKKQEEERKRFQEEHPDLEYLPL